MSALSMKTCQLGDGANFRVVRGGMAPMQQSSDRRLSVGLLVATPHWEVLRRRTSKCASDYYCPGCLYTIVYWRFGKEA